MPKPLLRAARLTLIASAFFALTAQLPNPGEIIKGLAADQALKALGETARSETPIVSSAQDVYPTVATLAGGPFHPTTNGQRTLAEQVRRSRSGTVTLPPGDYVIGVDVYCMQAHAGSPNGHGYLLAPLKGRMADVIAALNARSVGSGIPHSQLQTLSWEIQAGVKYADMPPRLRTIVDRLLPDYRSRLEGGYFDRLQGSYAQYARTVPGMPASFEAALAQMGGVGAMVQRMQQTRDELRAYSNNYHALAGRLVPQTSAAPASLPLETPWSRISARTYARLVTTGNYATPGQLQARVLRSSAAAWSGEGVMVAALRADVDRVLAQQQGGDTFSITDQVGDPGDPYVQPLSMSPEPPVILAGYLQGNVGENVRRGGGRPGYYPPPHAIPENPHQAPQTGSNPKGPIHHGQIGTSGAGGRKKPGTPRQPSRGPVPPADGLFTDLSNCKRGFAVGSVQVGRPDRGLVTKWHGQQRSDTIWVKICNDHRPGALIAGRIQRLSTSNPDIYTDVSGVKTPDGFLIKSLTYHGEAVDANVFVSLEPSSW